MYLATFQHWFLTWSSIFVFSPSVRSMQCPVRCQQRTLPTWCLTRSTSMETVRTEGEIFRQTSETTVHFSLNMNFCLRQEWRIWVQCACVLFFRWAVLRRVHGGRPEWRNAAEDTNTEFGPLAHCPENSRRDKGHRLIFPDIYNFCMPQLKLGSSIMKLYSLKGYKLQNSKHDTSYGSF